MRITQTISLLLLATWLAAGSLYAQGPTPTGIVVAACAGSALTAGQPYYMTVDTTGSVCAKNTPNGTQDVNVKQIGGNATAVGNGTTSTGTIRVTLSSDSTGVVRLTDGTTNTNVIAGTNALKTDLSSVAGTATATAAAGIPKVGVTDGSGNVINSTANALYGVVRDAAGNARGANVDASNNLGVVVGEALPTGANTIGAVTQASGPWTNNVTQFGGNAVATGTGAGGLGIPRVTISNDSSLAANQSVNISQINAVTPLMGNGVTGTGSLRVTLASDTSSNTNNFNINTAQINGVAPTMGNGVSGTGVQRVTIASDSTGQVALATGTNTIGALTANQSVNLNQVAGTGVTAATLANFPTSQTLTARNLAGVQVNEKSSRWSVVSNPAAGSQGTASIAAEAAVRHVADCVAFSAAATAAPALTALTINLRDGATGAGTVIWTYQVVITVGTGQEVAPHSICGLNLPGTTNTAMTLEWSASLANLIESVSISGFNVS